MEIELREATHDDYDAVAAFTENTWADRDGSDYIPHVYHDWIDGDDRYTVVADAGDDIAGIVQCVMLSDWEAWGQGMRVNPDFRGHGVANRMTHELFDWARAQGATVLRNMVFSWNIAGLGQSRATGYDPITEFRWAHPEPDADADPVMTVTDDADAAWGYWSKSDARAHLRGLALDFEESWAVSELTRSGLHRSAENDELLVVQEDGTHGFACLSREEEQTNEDDETTTFVEYAVGAWADADAARSLFAAISRDAAERGADETRVLIPETPRFVTDTAYCRVKISDEPDFVMGMDLTKDDR
ncbi:GNAT family N-acetyltransferase [Haladaptatus sp. T7]|uniref:GNAT family N-acetyltransferase n=1 Tax=Haladaptatus sp. T7 TaxID=2029368 RepID=UPI0021A253F9|nr:GNAT family N-acetyltransferase [Haladaptatus sp. T7]GKZ13094.1 N-acetyltransferase [Haladaptatus sp. T7]